MRNPAHLQQFQSVSSLGDWKYRRLACTLCTGIRYLHSDLVFLYSIRLLFIHYSPFDLWTPCSRTWLEKSPDRLPPETLRVSMALVDNKLLSSNFHPEYLTSESASRSSTAVISISCIPSNTDCFVDIGFVAKLRTFVFLHFLFLPTVHLVPSKLGR